MPSEQSRAGVPWPIDSSREAWESGARSLAEGFAQAQEFWNAVARSWGEAVGLWVNQPPWGPRRDSAAALREWQEATLGLAQAWLRLWR